ncbi:MAG: type II toxin-antitoxin system prevent-host-death family antitoxin [Bryobacterales bacterium]|nr:type II toxin-antitoxin system prevent-host-death family antitoxin [Bryobacterales bacterium]MDE0265240.1 type II toxin-antitoxin system prevent-host-death family antitoxin [Bryobacterales bacterium]MDE0622457.1 type II toxin-antitoxin system prevent-host-death family antitoxin [Bryobacterales bacterium]
MSVIGAFDAKTHLPRLLRRVQEGERFVITKHNRPVAELIPFRERDTARIRAAIDRLAAFQKTHSLQGLSVRELIEDGRRF